jgi:urate oxidase
MAKSKMAKRSRAGQRTRAGAASFGLGQNNYGKSRVRMVKVSRKGKVHTVRELDVAIALEGDFDAIHTRGDNSLCLPTDTMKNTVYALGKDHPIESIEEFALHLARHFVKHNPQVRSASVGISQVPWKRVKGARGDHPHCFVKGSEERRTCEAWVGSEIEDVTAGISDLILLKSNDSAFSGYPKDRYTTLPETRDRIFCTSITATWEYPISPVVRPKKHRPIDYGRERDAIRRALIDTFAAHKSESVQHTLYEMGRAALKASPAADSIRLSLPNKHCLLVNLKPFGMTNRNEIFVPTDEPHGLIEATVERR